MPVIDPNLKIHIGPDTFILKGAIINAVRNNNLCLPTKAYLVHRGSVRTIDLDEDQEIFVSKEEF